MSAPAPVTEIEVTPEMIEAGVEVFYDSMVERDYLAGAPNESHIRAMVAKIYSAMKSAKPRVLMNCM